MVSYDGLWSVKCFERCGPQLQSIFEMINHEGHQGDVRGRIVLYTVFPGRLEVVRPGDFASIVSVQA